MNILNSAKRFLGRVDSRAPSLHTSASQVSIVDAPNRTYNDHHPNGRCPTSGKEESLPRFCINASSISRQSPYPTASGGLGDVYKCTRKCDAAFDEVAVKSPRFQNLSEDQAAKINKACGSLDREIGIWAILEHDYVLPFHGTVEGFGPFRALVSPWMPKGNLDSYLKHAGETLTATDRLRILKQITEGLKYLHENNVIHGDLTSTNVLIAADGSPRLADFGISNIVMLSNPEFSHHTGAVRWAAPEFMSIPDDQTVQCGTISSDIYALGGIMLQVLYGKQPYWWLRSPLHVVTAKHKDMEPINSSIQIEPNHLDFMRRCWSVKSTARPSVEDVLKFLQVEEESQSV
ncbi:kinase-like protein [Rhizopogon salebrosus TDB-379]|nr:kinase-like protein [Rhizopogon salebrosus TDB-379]